MLQQVKGGHMKARVVIIGGGFSGAMTALHLLKKSEREIDIKIVEPREVVGLGLAYSTTCDDHLLNVPAGQMSAFSEEPEHFLNYARGFDAAVQADSFLPRKFYGQYIASLFQTTAGKSVAHVKDMVKAVNRSGRGFKLELESGACLDADFVVVATGNLSGGKPNWLQDDEFRDRRYIHNPWQSGCLEQIAKDEAVLVVGTGLTAVDKLIELENLGHQGPIYTVSRHGLWPCAHVQSLVGRKSEIIPRRGSVLRALSDLRAQVRERANDESWRLLFDGLRSHTQSFWASLSVVEKKRFQRHLKTYFDIHRHRMAPQIANRLRALFLRPTLCQTLAARIESVVPVGMRLQVRLQMRESQIRRTIYVDRIINCTGPQADLFKGRSILSALDAKLTAAGEFVGSDGMLIPRIYALGPMLQSLLLESVAVPELRGQAEAVAASILRHPVFSDLEVDFGQNSFSQLFFHDFVGFVRRTGGNN
ncbi:MAG: FAD/NAD(P)-binding protein [Candidatus Melainabacteria bacterium]|nr:FAD/NAD(P)-binding protein [Candidatus Melainabacteria bacterium]